MAPETEMTQCPSDAELAVLLEGRLPEADAARVEQHIAACSACRAVAGGRTEGDREPAAALAAVLGETLGRGASVGRYLVLSLVGQGGMGEVYAAYDPDLDRRVALKLLHTAQGSEGARRRLLREARALGKLSHPNVVQVYDVGEHRADVFVAMELVEGQAFDAWCRGAPVHDGGSAPKPSAPAWREVLAAYLDAARGLAAAHEKGLIHRDVKPSNILRGTDGRVRVADFGLAAGSEDAAREETAGSPEPIPADAAFAVTWVAPSTPGGGDGRLTSTGAILGTPLYMAPEQHDGGRASPASDQYSLCTALYQGLYGALPFAAGPDAGLAEVFARKRNGVPAAPPAGSPVPAWVHRALVRGLAPAPEGRYPSMGALVAALGDDPDARRRARWLRAGVGAAAATLLAVAAAGWSRSGAFEDPCAHPERQLAGVWDDGVKGRVRAALTATGRPYADDTATRVARILDRHAGAWAAMRGEVCEASRSRRQRKEIVGLRDECLDRRLAELGAQTTLLAEKADAQVLDRAVQAATSLSSVASCADLEALTARVRPPEDPALRVRVAELQQRVDRIEALVRAGKTNDGLALGEPLLAETATLPYAPLRAQVRYRMGQLREMAGDYEQARGLLREAAASAAEVRDEDTVTNAWAYLLFVVGERQRHVEEGAAIESLGETVVARAHDDAARANWMNSAGMELNQRGKLTEARQMFERSLAIWEKSAEPRPGDLTGTLNNLGNVLQDMGDYAGARAALERALGIEEEALGPDHPDLGDILYNLGSVRDAMGDYPLALRDQERALAIREKRLGPDHVRVAMSLDDVAGVLLHLGAYARAGPMFERALRIKEGALGPDSMDVGYPLAGLGRVRVRLGQLDAALPVLERARAALEKGPALVHRDAAEPMLGLGELHLARAAPEEAARVLSLALALDHPALGPEVELTLAEALWQVGKDRPRAIDLAERARAFYEHLGHRPGLDRATRWLAKHPRGG